MKRFISIILVALFVSTLSFAKTSVELFYYKQEIKDALTEMVAEFEKSNSDITIELEMVPNDSAQVLRSRLVGGTGPDIIQLQSYSMVQEFAAAGYLLDLSKDSVMKKVVDGSKSSVTYRNRLYALPMDLAGIGIIYNKKIFAKYGLKPPTKFSELKNVCAALKKNGVVPFAALLKANWSMGHFISLVQTSLIGDSKKVMSWLEDFRAGKASFGDPIKKNDLFMIMDFYKANMDPKAAEFDWNEQVAQFANEEAAMMVQGLWSYGAAIGANPKLDCGFIAFPVNDKSNPKLFADVDSTFAINKAAAPDKIKAAKKFFDWLSSPIGIKMWVEKCKLVPTFKGADVSSMDQPFQDLVEYFSKGNTLPWAFSMYSVATFEDACKNGAQEYMFGTKSGDQVISYIDELAKRDAK